jgi:hypothetical protein
MTLLAEKLAAAKAVDPSPQMRSAATPVVPAERILRFYTAREMAARAPEKTEFIAFPLAAAGSLTELDSHPKRGKTTLVLGMCAAILMGRPFLGRPTIKSPVVYLTEQGSASFRAALGRAGLLDRDDFYLLSWPDVSGAPWPRVVAAAVAKCNEVGAHTLVVDTLGQWANLRGDAENDAGNALTAVQPVQEAAALHMLAVVLLRHERKAGGEVGESGRGSSAFAGSVDTIFQLRRPEGGGRPGLRVLNALSRFSDIPEHLVIELTETGYIAHGDGAHLALEQAKQAILAAAPTDVSEALRLTELIEAAGIKRTMGQEACKVLEQQGVLRRTGKAVKGDPIRYWRPDGEADVDPVTDSMPAAVQRDGTAAERNGDSTDGHAVGNEPADQMHAAAPATLLPAERIEADGPPISRCVTCSVPLLGAVTGDRCLVCHSRAVAVAAASELGAA